METLRAMDNIPDIVPDVTRVRMNATLVHQTPLGHFDIGKRIVEDFEQTQQLMSIVHKRIYRELVRSVKLRSDGPYICSIRSKDRTVSIGSALSNVWCWKKPLISLLAEWTTI